MADPTLSGDGKSLVTMAEVSEDIAGLEKKKDYFAGLVTRHTAELASASADLAAVEAKIAKAVELGYVAP